MKDRNLLTIATAAYNSEKTLGETIASLELVSDLFEVLDILVIDDGSTDSTGMIADSFAGMHPHAVRSVHKANGGYGSAVNLAIDIAKGKYFKLLDSDDIFSEKGLRDLIAYIRAEESREEGGSCSADLILTPYIEENRPDQNRSVISDVFSLTAKADAYDKMSVPDFRKGISMFEICVRTDLIRASGVRFSENCFYTDNEFAMASMLYSDTVVSLPSPVYIYHLGVPGQSMSVTARALKSEDKIRAAYGVFNIYGNYMGSCRHESTEKIDPCASAGEAQNRISCTVKSNAAAEMVSMMAREVYVSHMLKDDPLNARSRLHDFDSELKRQRPEIYKLTRRSRLVRSAGKAPGLIYLIMCSKLRAHENKRTEPSADSKAVSGLKVHTRAAALGLTEQPKAAGYVLYMTASYIAAACMIVQCRSEWMHLCHYGMYVNRICWAVMMAALIYLTASDSCRFHLSPDFYGANKISGPGTAFSAEIMRNAALYLFMAAYTLIFLIFNPVNPLRVIRCASAVIMITALVRSEGGKRKAIYLAKCFRSIMLITGLISLVIWIMSAVLHILPMSGSVLTDWSPAGDYTRVPTFLCIYFEPQPTDWTFMSARCSGIFTEGPMAGFCLSLALMAELFICGHRDKARHRTVVALLIVCVISTLSLISWIAAFLSITGALVIKYRQKAGAALSEARNPAGKKRMLIAAASAAASAAMLLLARFSYDKLTAGSGSIRINDFLIGFQAWLGHPFFGGGFESLDYLRSFMPEWRFGTDIGYSNSPLQILAQGGIWIAVPYICAFTLTTVRAVRRRDAASLILTAIFAFLFTFTAVPYQYITFFVLILMCTDCISRKPSKSQETTLNE